MSKAAVFLDSFSGAIGSMKARDQRDPVKVLRVLDSNPDFSVFDATERPAIANTLDYLKDNGYVFYPQPQPDYPWCKVELTEKGRESIRTQERASRGYNSAGYLGTEFGPYSRPRGPNAMSPMNPSAPWNQPTEVSDEHTADPQHSTRSAHDRQTHSEGGNASSDRIIHSQRSLCRNVRSRDSGQDEYER